MSIHVYEAQKDNLSKLLPDDLKTLLAEIFSKGEQLLGEMQKYHEEKELQAFSKALEQFIKIMHILSNIDDDENSTINLYNSIIFLLLNRGMDKDNSKEMATLEKYFKNMKETFQNLQ
ncbi:MAG: hypothetical protein ACTSXG_02260 [Alphaproteobacteria bacterium]